MPIRTALTAVLLASAAPAFADTCATIEVQNVRPQQGQLMVAVYNSAESVGKQPLASVKVPAGDATTRFEVCKLSGSELLVQLFQDLDSDGKMGRNLLGMPTEPWGSSGAPGLYGPTWDTGKVPLDGKPIVVRLSQ